MEDETKEYQIPLDDEKEFRTITKEIENVVEEIVEVQTKLDYLLIQERRKRKKLWDKIYEYYPELEKKVCSFNKENLKVIVKKEDTERSAEGFVDFLKEMFSGDSNPFGDLLNPKNISENDTESSEDEHLN